MPSRVVATRKLMNRTGTAISVQHTSMTRPTMKSVSSNNSQLLGKNKGSAEAMVHQLLRDAAVADSITKGGWCLKQGLTHVATADNGRLFELVESQGLPLFYYTLSSCRHNSSDDDMIKTPENSFQSLCRIVAGQQLAGKAARAIWNRLLETAQHDLAPKTILSLAGPDGKNLEAGLQKPSGLSRAKARSIFDLAQKFDAQDITETFLTNPDSTEEEIRETLLQIKGLGPWSCDMFIMFHLEKVIGQFHLMPRGNKQT